jgi:hypothetical protein
MAVLYQPPLLCYFSGYSAICYPLLETTDNHQGTATLHRLDRDHIEYCQCNSILDRYQLGWNRILLVFCKRTVSSDSWIWRRGLHRLLRDEVCLESIPSHINLPQSIGCCGVLLYCAHGVQHLCLSVLRGSLADRSQRGIGSHGRRLHSSPRTDCGTYQRRDRASHHTRRQLSMGHLVRMDTVYPRHRSLGPTEFRYINHSLRLHVHLRRHRTRPPLQLSQCSHPSNLTHKRRRIRIFHVCIHEKFRSVSRRLYRKHHISKLLEATIEAFWFA